MNKTQALSILMPKEKTTEGLKAAYREASFKFNPDQGGNVEIMKLVNLAFELLKEIDWTTGNMWNAKNATPLTETMSKLWNTIKTFPKIEGEIVGSWLWVTGDTYNYKDQLKAAGFKFAGNKKSWYWHEGEYRKKSKKSFSMDNIRTMWGSNDLESETSQAIA